MQQPLSGNTKSPAPLKLGRILDRLQSLCDQSEAAEREVCETVNTYVGPEPPTIETSEDFDPFYGTGVYSSLWMCLNRIESSILRISNEITRL